MVMTYAIRDYQHPEDAPALLEISNTWQTPPLTLAQFLEREDQRAVDELPLERFVLELSGVICGYAQVIPHGFVPPNWAGAGIMVHPDQRNKGYGQILWQELKKRLSKHCLQGLESYIRDDDTTSRAWAEAKGFEYYANRFASVLNLETFDESRFVGQCDRVKASGIEIRSFAEIVQTESDWDKVLEFVADSLARTPDLEGNPPWSLAQVAHWVRDESQTNAARVFLAIEAGNWVGISVLTLDRGQTYNFITAVNPSHRGRGIALALKLEAIKTAKALGYTKMSTNNLSINAPMLEVNKKLGFEHLPGRWLMRLKLEDAFKT
jgi:GNAT superfamily N-acetyltransferase